jgi:D-alanine-D-alanine ligase
MVPKIRVGIVFGGSSREREVSFAGGRTVYDCLDRTVFEAIPLFIDSYHQVIELDWQYIYKGTIRDFYPPRTLAVGEPGNGYIEGHPLGGDPAFQVEAAGQVGRLRSLEELKTLVDVVFLCLHGSNGEDGSIQGLLQWLGIPYTGAGIWGSSFGSDKELQHRILNYHGFEVPRYRVVVPDKPLQPAIDWVGVPAVVKIPTEGSSLGVAVCQTVADVRAACELFFAPPYAAPRLLVEAYLQGTEFSIVVIERSDGTSTALPPTQILTPDVMFDYNAKYLPGRVNKKTPMELPTDVQLRIADEAIRLKDTFGLDVYARIDGFLTPDNRIYLNDPNTTSGMLPGSFFFHQAAEFGFTPTAFLTHIIQTSLLTRIRESFKQAHEVHARLLQHMVHARAQQDYKRRIGVVMGGYSFERHISMESGRNIFEKLNSSTDYRPIPYFLLHNTWLQSLGELSVFEGRAPHTLPVEGFSLWQLPIQLMLKENADDIANQIISWIKNPEPHPVVETLYEAFVGSQVPPVAVNREPRYQPLDTLAEAIDFCFIALHGRPGEDGTLQALLERHDIPYNGSGPESSALTIDKYRTNRHLALQGFRTADQRVFTRTEWVTNPDAVLEEACERFGLPLIAKPVDDGCSSAVAKIKTREQLADYLNLLFYLYPSQTRALRERLGINPAEEFPFRDSVLIERFIGLEPGYQRIVEVTVGVRQWYDDTGRPVYQAFAPSETVALESILSLEEKFLAGEGQNLTPAQFSADPAVQEHVQALVQQTMQAVAQAVDVRGYCRIDAFVRLGQSTAIDQLPDVEVWIIEVNSLPGMTPATVIFHQAACEGLTPLGFIDWIIRQGTAEAHHKALARHQ